MKSKIKVLSSSLSLQEGKFCQGWSSTTFMFDKKKKKKKNFSHVYKTAVMLLLTTMNKIILKIIPIKKSYLKSKNLEMHMWNSAYFVEAMLENLAVEIAHKEYLPLDWMHYNFAIVVGTAKAPCDK